jgi:ubiquinone biosynthesis protein COQ9
MTEAPEDRKTRLLDAALIHVPFDGWSEKTFRAAAQDAGISRAEAKAICPRGALDLALAFHERGDKAMEARLKSENMADMRFRDKVAAAVRFRLEAIENKEAARRATTLFSLPIHAADGARAVWGTADRIWTALGDSSDDVNWYTKRATLSGVYAATVLYWLGDDSVGHTDTWEFLDRRIDNVMQIEKVKARAREMPVLGRLMEGPNWLFGRIRPPTQMRDPNMPGHWSPSGTTPPGDASQQPTPQN